MGDIFVSEEKSKPKFKYFRIVDTDKKEPVVRTIKGKVQKYEKTITERVYFEPKDVFSFNLEDVTISVSVDDGGGFTQYHNYIWLWTQFIGGMSTLTYMAIRKYLFDYIDRQGTPEEFIAFPPLDEICKRIGVKDRNTLNGYLDVLEQYGFLYRFWTAIDMHDHQGKSNGSKDTGLVFIIRKKIPLLPDDLVEKLSDEDRKYHNKIKNLIGKSGIVISCEEEYKAHYKRHLKDLLEKGVFTLSNGKKKNTYVYIEDGQLVAKPKEEIHHEIKSEELKQEDIVFWKEVLDSLSKKISKPSFETWFGNTLAYRKDKNLIVLAPNQFACDWIDTRYKEILDELIQTEFEEKLNIIVDCLDKA